MQRLMKLLPVMALGVLTLALAACTDGTSTGEDHVGNHAQHDSLDQIAEPVPGAPEISVSAVDIDFAPASIEVPAGQPANLTITNDGATMHDFTLPAADVHVNVEPGEAKTTSIVIAEPGRYEATCTVPGHAEGGMTLDVVVTDGDDAAVG